MIVSNRFLNMKTDVKVRKEKKKEEKKGIIVIKTVKLLKHSVKGNNGNKLKIPSTG